MYANNETEAYKHIQHQERNLVGIFWHLAQNSSFAGKDIDLRTCKVEVEEECVSISHGGIAGLSSTLSDVTVVILF